MQTDIQTLYQFSKNKYKLSLLAGKEGLTNSVSWVYLSEDIQNVTFLKGGEFVITTGLFLLQETLLFDFIKAIALQNCSALLINTGKYIRENEITQEMIDYCNRNKLPLFTMPWEIHLVEIMQDYSSLLLSDNRKAESLSAAFQSTLYQDPIPESVLWTLNQYGFSSVAPYRIIVAHNLRDVTRVTSLINRLNLKYHVFSYDNHYVFIFQSDFSSLLLSKLVDTICFCDEPFLGISDEVFSLSQISNGYKRSRFALAVAEFWRVQVISFDELGVFTILFNSTDPTILPTLVQKYLGPLMDYDQFHDTNYLETLRYFLLSDCNLLETSQRMFTHRNTVVYRIKKIKEILNTQLNDSSIKFNLLLAFYIQEYLTF